MVCKVCGKEEDQFCTETSTICPRKRILPSSKVTFTYSNPHRLPEKGIVKSLALPHYAFVVYSCNDEWENYENYTAQKSEMECITLGWPQEDIIDCIDRFFTTADKLIDNLEQYEP